MVAQLHELLKVIDCTLIICTLMVWKLHSIKAVKIIINKELFTCGIATNSDPLRSVIFSPFLKVLKDR